MTTQMMIKHERSVAARSAGVVVAVALMACACADPSLPVAPGAVVVVVARTADVLALESALLRSGLIDGSVLAPLGPALVADAPMVASVLPSGATILATRIDVAGGRGLAREARAVLGKTVAVAVAGRPALLRVDGARALVAFDVALADEASVAALLELLATDKDAATPAVPAPGSLSVRIEPSALPGALPGAPLIGTLDATIRMEAPSTLVATAMLLAPSAALRAALTSSSPPWSCALDEGAAAVLAIPPLPGPSAPADGDERFAGRMLVAVYPPTAGSPEEREGVASIVIAGTPHGDVARDQLLEGLRTGLREGLSDAAALAAERTEQGPEGTRHFLEVDGKRRLRAVVDDRLFLLAVGAAAPVDRIAGAARAPSPCPVDARALVRMDGARLQKLLLPLLMTPDVVLRALAATPGADSVPLARLRGIERFDVDARAEGDAVRIDGRLVLGSMAAP